MGLIELSLWDKLKRIKADKVVGAVEGNFAKLDANGNLVDSGHKDADYEDADATILKEADVVDSLDSTSTTAPLSANQGKVLNDAIDEVEGRVDETQASLLTTKLAVNELERQAQIGNGATLDFEDIGIVPLDARATGRANPTVEGLTATNIVDGAGIADLGTVTFASVLNHKYFDVLHGMILTGTGSDMTITNDTGATADIAVIYLTGVYGLGNEPSEADCAKIFSYFDGTKSISMPARVRSVSEDESETSTLYIADNKELRSVPAISDEVKVVNGQLVKVQNVQRYVLSADDILSITDRINVAYVRTKIFADNRLFTTVINNWVTVENKKQLGDYTTEWDIVGNDNNTTFATTLEQRLLFFLPKGTTYSQAQAALAGTVIYYQLATPIITPLTTSGTLKAFQNGTVYYEPYYEGSHQTDASSEITLPYEGTIEAVYGYDEDLVEYLLDSSEYSLTGTTLTITDALENEVFFVQMSRSEPLAPEMSVNVINNEQVIADTSNGKFYKLVPTITNGELVSQTPVEVV